jgi:hypothetical protein
LSKKYVGMRHPQTRHPFRETTTIVSVVDGELASPLDAGYRYVNHSPTGFDWGYMGSGPAQLAFAILLDHFNAPGPALLFYQDFKEQEIAAINAPRWEMTREQVEAALERIRIFRSRAKSEANCPDTT